MNNILPEVVPKFSFWDSIFCLVHLVHNSLQKLYHPVYFLQLALKAQQT